MVLVGGDECDLVQSHDDVVGEVIADEIVATFGVVPIVAVVTHAVAPTVADMASDVLRERVQLARHHVRPAGSDLGRRRR